jgi:hypothetical protein
MHKTTAELYIKWTDKDERQIMMKNIMKKLYRGFNWLNE